MGVTGGPFRIDSDLVPGVALDVTDDMNSGFRCASEAHSILHTFYWGDDGVLDAVLYRKSLDGGQTFLDPETISPTAYGLPAIWADWWNGGTGTKIHISYVSGGTKGVYYNYLDTATGAFGYAAGSEPFAYDGNGIRPNALPGQVITKLSNGILIIAFNDGGDGGVWLMSKDDGASWVVMADQPLLAEDLGGPGEGAWAIAEVGSDDRCSLVVRDITDTAFYNWVIDLDDDTGQGLRTGEDTVSVDINGTNHYGQTFQVGTAHYLKMVKFKCYRVGSPGTITCSLYATSGGLPTGAALATATLNGNNFTTDTAGEWEYFFFIPKYATQLTATTTYAVCLDADTAGTATDYIKILVDSGNGYANGQAVSGPTWSAVVGSDCIFVEAQLYVNGIEKFTITPAPTGDTLLLGSTALCSLQNPVDGYTYLVYNTGGSDGTGSIYCKRFDPATNTWADRTTILTTDGVADTSVDVSLAIDEGNGDLFVVYNYNNTTVTVVDFDIYFKKSTDGGNTWGTAVKLPTGAIDDHRWPRTNAYTETGIAGVGGVVYVEYGNDDLNDFYGVWLDFTYPYPDLETDFTPLINLDTQADWQAWSDGPVNDNTPLIYAAGLWFADWKNGTTSPFLAGSEMSATASLIGSPVSLTGKAISLDLTAEPAYIKNAASKGMYIRFTDGQTPTAGWAEYTIGGSDTLESGRQTILLAGDATPVDQSSSPTFDKTDVVKFGLRCTAAVKDNKDVERFVLHSIKIGSQLIIKGGTASDKLSFEKVRGWSDFFGHGLFSRLGDLFVSVAKIIFGDVTGVVDTYFEDTNKVLQFSPGGFGDNYYTMEFVGDAAKTFDVKLGDYVTSGADKSGFSGCTISTAPDRLGQADRVSIVITDADAIPAIAGCKFLNIQDMTLLAATEALIDSSVEITQPIEVNGALINSGKFVSAPIGSVKLDATSEATVLKNLQFVNNGKAVLITTAGTYDFNNWRFFSNTVDISSSVEATLVDSYAPIEDGDVDVYSGSITRVAQQFTATAGVLSHAIFSIRKQGAPTGNVVAKLYSNSAGTPGTLLATSENVDITGLTTAFADVGFEFRDEYTLVDATEYHMSIEYAGGDASNRLEVEYLTAGDAGETCNTYVASWSGQTYDCRFQVNRDGIVIVNASNGSDPSTTEITAAVPGALIIKAGKTFSFTLSPAITGYEWRLYYVTALGSLVGAVEQDGEESAILSSQSFSYNYSGDQPIAVQIIPQPDHDYEESITYYTLKNSDQSVTILLREDINN